MMLQVPDMYHRSGQSERKKRQTKFNCSVNIHQFNAGDRETANIKRRMSVFHRRKSMSADAIQKQLAAASSSVPGTPAPSSFPKRRQAVDFCPVV